MVRVLALTTAMLFLFSSETDFPVLKNITAGKWGIECSSEKKKAFSAHIICDYDRYNDNIYHQAYLVVELGTDTIIKDLGGSFGDTLFVCDIDGDNIDEIIIQQTTGMSGGAGQYTSSIFKIADDNVNTIFSSGNTNKFDTGFFGKLKSDYQLEIRNNFTGYMKTLSLADNNKYSSAYFDENGDPLRSEVVLSDTFREFIPKDIDGDGVYEIACLQYLSIVGHSNYIGDAKCFLKYNTQENKFEIVKAEFIPKIK